MAKEEDADGGRWQPPEMGREEYMNGGRWGPVLEGWCEMRTA